MRSQIQPANKPEENLNLKSFQNQMNRMNSVAHIKVSKGLREKSTIKEGRDRFDSLIVLKGTGEDENGIRIHKKSKNL